MGSRHRASVNGVLNNSKVHLQAKGCSSARKMIEDIVGLFAGQGQAFIIKQVGVKWLSVIANKANARELLSRAFVEIGLGHNHSDD